MMAIGCTSRIQLEQARVGVHLITTPAWIGLQRVLKKCLEKQKAYLSG
jgi:hypothetical protein